MLITITLALDCRDDVPAHVVTWMAENLMEHAAHEFSCDYEPEFVRPAYEGPPVAGDVRLVSVVDESGTEVGV